MKKTILALALLMFFIVPFSAHAFIIKKDGSVYLNKDEVIDDNLLAVGNIVTIEGTVKGDLICAAAAININGNVEGDIICGGQSININGEVGGNVRVVGNTININNKVGRNITAAGGFINLSDSAQVGSDLIIGAGSSEVRGKVARDVVGGGGNMVVSGEVGRNIKLWLDSRSDDQTSPFQKNVKPLLISDTAKIGGNVEYSSGRTGEIMQGAAIAGELKHNLPTVKKINKKDVAAIYGGIKIISLFSMLVIGLVLISLWREEMKKITDLMLEKIGKSMGWGLVVLFLTPAIIVVLLMTIIGIPLALIIGALWLIILYVSKIITGILIGRSFLDKFWTKKKDSIVLAMILGILAIWLVCMLPIIGWALSFVAMIWGLGGLWLFFKKA